MGDNGVQPYDDFLLSILTAPLNTGDRSVYPKLIGFSLEEVNETQKDNTLLESDQLVRAANIVLLLSSFKGLHYGRSWCKRGMYGIFFTIARKWDRLEGIFTSGVDPWKAGGSEGVEETILDLAVYSLKWLGYLKESNPERFEAMVAKAVKDAQKDYHLIRFFG